MKDFGECPICGEYDFLDVHKCNPAWCVQIAKDDPDFDDSEEPTVLHAWDRREAGEKFAEQRDSESCDYYVLNGNPIRVAVWPFGCPDEKQTFVVSGESVPEYNAMEVDSA